MAQETTRCSTTRLHLMSAQCQLRSRCPTRRHKMTTLQLPLNLNKPLSNELCTRTHRFYFSDSWVFFFQLPGNRNVCGKCEREWDPSDCHTRGKGTQLTTILMSDIRDDYTCSRVQTWQMSTERLTRWIYLSTLVRVCRTPVLLSFPYCQRCDTQYMT